jgi:hypothetical protein
MRRRLPLILLVTLLSVAGCGGRHMLARGDLSSLVLQKADLGSPFSEFSFGPVTKLDTQGTVRADPSRYGHIDGWVGRYRRAASAVTRGPVVVESRADVFKDAGGAKTDLAAYADEFARTPATHVRRLSLPSLGDGAVGVTFVQASSLPLRFFRIAWRVRNATASITVEGFDGRVTLTQALGLARKQEVRIVAK